MFIRQPRLVGSNGLHPLNGWYKTSHYGDCLLARPLQCSVRWPQDFSRCRKQARTSNVPTHLLEAHIDYRAKKSVRRVVMCAEAAK